MSTNPTLGDYDLDKFQSTLPEDFYKMPPFFLMIPISFQFYKLESALPLKEGVVFHFNKLESASPKYAVSRLIEICQVILEKKLKTLKAYRRAERLTDSYKTD